MQRWRHSEAEIHGNLKNPISQLRPSSSSSRGEAAKTEFYPHPSVVKLEVERKSFARFLPFLPVFDFENWILGRFPLKREKYSVRQNFVFPTNGRRRGIKLNPLCGIFALRPLLLSTPLEIYFSIAEKSWHQLLQKFFSRTKRSNPLCGIFAWGPTISSPL